MNKCHFNFRAITFLILFPAYLFSFSQSKGLKTITEKELRYHLEFLGAREFRGRETPSPELEIATLYLGNWAKNASLKPIMKDGSFYQVVPFTVTSVFQPGTKISIFKGNGEEIYYFGKAFGGNFSVSGSYSGSIVFAGLGISDPDNGWDDLKDLDLTGKIVIILDDQRPGSENSSVSYAFRLNSRIFEIRNRGASAVLSIINADREKRLTDGVKVFDYIPTGRIGILFDSQRISFASAPEKKTAQTAVRPSLPFERAEISHELASEILGVTKKEISEMFKMTKQGLQVPSEVIPGIRVKLEVEMESYESYSRNVIAVVEGSDPVLKNEYIIVCGHHDARGIDDGEIIAGADDNGTAIVALMEIAQALLTEKPKRSVIISWFTGEEQGMNGSHYFINNSPVPVEKISACLDIDMIGRNNPDSLFLVGSNLLSSGLDASINRVNRKSGINLGFDYRYSNLSHPQRVYFRSDHYPFIRFGIPSVWFFCGFTPDYHTPRDVPEYINYTKFLKTTKLVYLTAFDIGNMDELLKLDVNPKVISRGRHNLTESSLFQYTAK
jgi:hypothetical protein